MATTTKKTNAKPRSPAAKKSQSERAQSLQALRRELAEALEQQAATSEILRVIASSPADIQPVLGGIDELVEAEPAGELALKGFHRPVAAYNVLRLKA